MPLLVSQLIALAWNQKFSTTIMGLVSNAPSWVKTITEFFIGYFEKSGDWLFVWTILFVVVLMIFAKLVDKEERTKHGFFFLAGFVLLFVSILLFVLPNQANTLKEISKNQEKILQDKITENYLVQRIEKLEAELLSTNTQPNISVEELSRLNDKIIILKSKLYALQIDDKVIDQAQAIIEKEQKKGVPRALKLIEENNQEHQLQKLREQNQKQAKISRYKAGLYVWVNQWEKADQSYKDSIEFFSTFDSYFDYAYFLQLHRANFKEAEKFYIIALHKTEELSKKAMSLNNLAILHSNDSTKRAEALAEYEEALEIYRDLAKENAKIYLFNVAMILNNLANFHSNDSTKRAEALAKNKEALEIYRDLAKENAKIYLPNVAMSLNNLAILHSDDSTKRAEALAEYEEALEIRRALAKENPKVYLPDVAMSLNNLAIFHSKDSTKRAEALAEYEEALEIRRTLAKENPKVYARDCATTLVMGVHLFGDDKAYLDEALRLLEVYPDSYMNVGWLREMIAQMKGEGLN